MAQFSERKNQRRSRLLLVMTALGTILLGAILAMSGWGIIALEGSLFSYPDSSKLAGLLLIASGLVVLAFGTSIGRYSHLLSGAAHRVIVSLEAWNVRDDALAPRNRAINLVLVSLLGLLFELALIRWLAEEIKVFAYLKNIVLIAAFLGLGLGFFLARRRYSLLPLFLPFAAGLVITVVLGAAFGIWSQTVMPGGEQLVLLGLSFGQLQPVPVILQVISWVPYYGITIVYFLFVVMVFVPVGQYTGKCLSKFEAIPGYSLNLVGSLGGTLLFAAVSFAWLPPVVWFGLVVLIALAIVRQGQSDLARLNLVTAIVFVAAQGVPGSTVWSPYHKLVLRPLTITDADGQQYPWGYQLSIGDYYYQDLANLSREFFVAHPDLPAIYQNSEYEVPYKFIHPSDVLILGAGTGNDVAAALRNGAQNVDAVDIDPGILGFGQEFHPERPYDSPRVTRIVDDARAYIRRSDKRYDLVLFGLLDSQQVLSAFGSVRLDNFVYTVEGIREAYARVKSHGMLTITFETYQPWIAARMSEIIETATGQKPVVINAHHGTVYMVRKDVAISQHDVAAALVGLSYQAKPVALDSNQVPLTTDDWPYLYLRDREIPFAYLSMLMLLGLVSAGLASRVLGTGWRIRFPFFFLGAAFLLMEVRIIAQVALLFGSTWLVNVAAIASVLFMAILANVFVALRKPATVGWWGVCLLATLVVSSLIPSSFFLNWGQIPGAILAVSFLALPIFFAGVVFAVQLRRTPAVEIALASNLLGSILGGLVEYVSLLLGIGSLGWIATVLYIIALVPRREKP